MACESCTQAALSGIGLAVNSSDSACTEEEAATLAEGSHLTFDRRDLAALALAARSN
jgi:hypothetical protein